MLSDYLYLLLRSPHILSAAIRIGKERSLAGINKSFRKRKTVLNVKAGPRPGAADAHLSSLKVRKDIAKPTMIHDKEKGIWILQ